MLNAPPAALNVCRVEIRALLKVLAHTFLKEELIHATLELRKILALRVLSRDHLQAVEISVYAHEHGHAEEAKLDGVRIVANEAVDKVFRQPSDAIQRGDGNGETRKHALGPMAAFGSDEFLIDPASHSQAFLHLMQVIAPGLGDFSSILRIENHKPAPNCNLRPSC